MMSKLMVKLTAFHGINTSKYKGYLGKLVKMIFIAGFCFIIMYPIIVMLSRAFMSQDDLFDNTVILIPKNVTFVTIVDAMNLMNYWKTLANTMAFSLTTTVIQTFTCIMTGYGFARFKFRGQKLMFTLVVFTIIIPPQLIMVSLYMHFRYFDVFGIIRLITGQPGINLLDSFTPFYLLSLGCMGIRNGLFIYMFRQFFRGFPKETEEAALVDGAGAFRIFFKIMIPASATIITTVFLFSLVWQYNDVTYTSLFLKNTKVLSMTYAALGQNNIGVFVLPSEYIAALKSTGVLLMLLPILAIYCFLQRFFVEGIERSGIVG